MTAFENTADWWRPAAPAAAPTAVVTGQQQGSRIAFGALVAFTGILILSPQVWFPVLKSLRIALVAAGLAIVAQLLDRAVRSHSSDRLHKEIVAASKNSEVRARMEMVGAEPGGSSQEEMRKMLSEQVSKVKPVIEDLKLIVQ